MVLTRGIPGSGKTEWAKAWVAEDEATRVRVSRDDLRFMIFGRYHSVDERVISNTQTAMLRCFMWMGFDIVLDNTNLNPLHVGKVRALASKYDYAVEFHDIEVDVEEAIFRDLNRDRVVGADVIRDFANRYTDGGKLRAS